MGAFAWMFFCGWNACMAVDAFLEGFYGFSALFAFGSAVFVAAAFFTTTEAN